MPNLTFRRLLLLRVLMLNFKNRIKMKKIVSIAIAGILLLLGSCDDYLERPPLDEISSEQYWKTINDIENYTLQFYASFPTFKTISFQTGTIGWDARRGSDHQIILTPVDQLNGTRSIVQAGNGWNWGNIRAVNIFFENYGKVKEMPENIKHFVGEAHFFKAWFYFELVKAFGDVPWYSNSLQMDSPELYDARTPRTQVVDSILYHLDKAVGNLRFLKDVDGGNNRLSKEAALIFKSRVALYEGSWQKYHAGTAFGTQGANPNKYFQAAVQATTELMTPGKYKVGIYNTGNPAEDYNTLFSSNDLSSNIEVVLWCKFDKTLSNFSHAFQQFITDFTDQISLTMGLVKNYLGKDGSPYDYMGLSATTKGTSFLSKIAEDCDPRLAQVIWIPGQVRWDNVDAGKEIFLKPSLDDPALNSVNNTGFQMRKGANPKDPAAGFSSGINTLSETGAVIFRYAEALLNYAEAQAELEQTVDYSKSLNLIRQRAGMPDFKVITDADRRDYANFDITLTDELYEIRRERAVELACEGFRYDDWRRWRAHTLFEGKRPKGFPLLKSEYEADLVVFTDDNGLCDPFKNIMGNGYNFNEKRDYLDCIPTNEITLNSNLVQNPGW